MSLVKTTSGRIDRILPVDFSHPLPLNRSMDLNRYLQDIFGHSSFRPDQEKIVQALLNGRDVFAVMPTGGGKSLCYQLPAKILEGACLVISPLISLMKDQVDGARANGLMADYFNSSQSRQEQHEVFERLQKGECDLLYLSPERLAVPGFLERLKRLSLSFVAVDEAHCISEWGHDFRPDYLVLSQLKQAFSGLVVAAFTATATTEVQSDIAVKLQLEKPLIIRASFDRPNLFYSVLPRQSLNRQILQFIRKRSGEAGIVYRLSRKDVEKTAAFLQKNGIKALPYHAGLDSTVRAENQEAFNRDTAQVVVATVAFGMGIDKSNVRFVLHGEMPKNMEGYYQETGRAGRDGGPANCVLFTSGGDYYRLRHFIVGDSGGKTVLGQLEEMRRFSRSSRCRRKSILAYFDEEYGGDNCGNCDICVQGVARRDASVDAQKLMSAVYRTGQRFGAGHVVDIVCGAKNKKIFSSGHDRLKTYGVGSDRSKGYWRQLSDEMLGDGLLRTSGNEYPILEITAAGEEVLFGRSSYQLNEIKQSAASVKVEESESDELFLNLKGLRLEMAREHAVPPFVIFSDRSLQQMATFLPTDDESLLAIDGVGQVKLERYGAQFLKAITDYTDRREPEDL
ncbi:MAG: DNA helicase RecQ [Thermodesulfobacteriota bacterium]